jgi:hypothetical protein
MRLHHKKVKVGILCYLATKRSGVQSHMHELYMRMRKRKEKRKESPQNCLVIKENSSLAGIINLISINR